MMSASPPYGASVHVWPADAIAGLREVSDAALVGAIQRGDYSRGAHQTLTFHDALMSHDKTTSLLIVLVYVAEDGSMFLFCLTHRKADPVAKLLEGRFCSSKMSSARQRGRETLGGNA